MKKLIYILLFLPSLVMGQTVIDSYTGALDFDQSLYAGSTYVFGQCFTNTSTSTLGSATFKLKKVGTPTGSGYAYVYAITGTYGTSGRGTGSPIATSDAFDVSTLTTGYVDITFTFSGANQITLSASTYYVITVGSNNGNSSNYVHVRYAAFNSPTHSGNQCTYNGSTWSYQGSRDGYFYVRTTAPVGTNKNIFMGTNF